MNIAAYTLRKRTIAWLACLVLLVGGYIAYQQLGRFEDPEFVIRQAVIVTPYPGALPAQVAEEVTDAIEGAVQQLQEVKEVTSVSTSGQSRVSVEIDLRFARTKDDLEQVWDKLRRKVADAQRLLPPGAGPSVVNDDFGDVYALFFAVTGDGYRLEQIRDYVEDLERELVLVPGVARVATQGAPQDAIFVEIAAAKAAQLGVSLEQIHQVLRERNLLAAAGDLRVGPQRVAVSPTGQVDSVEAIGNIVLASSGGDRIISLKDVATITRGVLEPPRALVRYDGEPAIGLGVSNLAGGNVVAMGDAVRARLAELESQRPVGVELNIVSYQSDAVRTAVDGFVANLVAAVVIVVLVLVLFMGLRSGLIVGAILLLTVAGTLIAMHLDGIAMQRISLGALIIALGMLVDNAIVVTDGILVRLQKGEERTRAPLAERAAADQLDNVQVYSPTARRYLPVGQLVSGVEVAWEDAVIRRVNRFPTIKAQADPPPGELSGPVLERLPRGRGDRPAARLRAGVGGRIQSLAGGERGTSPLGALRLRGHGARGGGDVQRRPPAVGDLADGSARDHRGHDRSAAHPRAVRVHGDPGLPQPDRHAGEELDRPRRPGGRRAARRQGRPGRRPRCRGGPCPAGLPRRLDHHPRRGAAAPRPLLQEHGRDHHVRSRLRDCTHPGRGAAAVCGAVSDSRRSSSVIPPPFLASTLE